MDKAFLERLQNELNDIDQAGLYKRERIITSHQGPEITVAGREGSVLNFCANNYLGLSAHPDIINAAKEYLDTRGFGMSSVRFICGTQDIHRELEQKIAAFCGTDDTILYAACFDANGGVFEPLLGEEDAIVSDSLNHASIIDGVRLCKAKRYRYESCNMEELEAQLKQAKADGARTILIATDAVFSMVKRILGRLSERFLIISKSSFFPKIKCTGVCLPAIIFRIIGSIEHDSKISALSYINML